MTTTTIKMDHEVQAGILFHAYIKINIIRKFKFESREQIECLILSSTELKAMCNLKEETKYCFDVNVAFHYCKLYLN